MNKRNEFLNGLRYEQGETSQKQVAEDAIKRQLFKILDESKLQKDESKDLNEVAENILVRLGLKQNKAKIAQFIIQLLQSNRYQYNIDENGNIRANYSRLYMLQKEDERKSHEEAEKILQGFIQKVEEHVVQLEQQKARVTEISIMRHFDEEEIYQYRGWIDLAIEHVLQAREK